MFIKVKYNSIFYPVNYHDHIQQANIHILIFILILFFSLVSFPTSVYRTPLHNTAVGGVPNSKHLTGKAVDYSYNLILSIMVRFLPPKFKVLQHKHTKHFHIQIN